MVFIQLPNKTLTLIINPSTTSLQALTLEINEKFHIPTTQQRLYSSCRRLLNTDVPLSQLGISPNSTLTLHVPLLGGMQAPGAPKVRLDFLNTRPPPNYVAGLGRGATGFTTRSDIGPTRAAPDLPDRWRCCSGNWSWPWPRAAERKRKTMIMGYDEKQKLDEFEGNDVGLFASAEYDEDDKEADAIWESIDQRMDSRRKDRREARLKQEMELQTRKLPNSLLI